MENKDFDHIGGIGGEFNDLFKIVQKDGKWNLIDEKGKLFSKIWFDKFMGIRKNGVQQVKFDNGFFQVQKDGKWNLINEKGKLISKIWVDSIYNKNGIIKVQKDGKRFKIDKKGKLIEIIIENGNDDENEGNGLLF